MSNSINNKRWFYTIAIISTITAIATFIVTRNKTSKVSSADQSTLISDSIKLAEFYKNEEAKPFINPPLNGVNIPYATYKISAANGGTIKTPTGTQITIPKNSFLDSSANLSHGEIEIKIREFHNPVDFFVSGIPMTYDSAGVRYQFESAGMIELSGYQNGKNVAISPDKKINVELASDYAGEHYNLYKLDTEINNWSCLGKDKVIKPKNVSTKTITTSAQKGEEIKLIEKAKLEVTNEKDKQLSLLPVITKEPQKPAKANADKYNFNLEVDASDYPELAVYKGLLFEVGEENKNFNQAAYNVMWDDATIKEGTKKGENYLLTLKKGTKKYSLIVYPVFEGKNYSAALKIYQEKYNAYNALLSKRKEQEQRIEEAYQAKLAELKKQEFTLQRKWENEQQKEFNLMNAQDKIKRVFSINSFGIYNCDSPVSYPAGKSCIAKITIDNKNLMCYDIFLVDKEKNALFNFYKNPILNFSYNPQSQNIIWTVENGVLYWLNSDQFKTLTVVNGVTKIEMNKVNATFKTAEEIKAFFNL